MNKVAAVITALDLRDADDNPATVITRDAQIYLGGVDTYPVILVTPGGDQQFVNEFSVADVITGYPTQITFLDAADRSLNKGVTVTHQWRDAVEKKFLQKQPYAINNQDPEMPDFYRLTVTMGEPIDHEAWKHQYTMHVMFVIIELLDTTIPMQVVDGY
jgi:hypothetical protein